jgi:hypothetical protein
MTKDLERKIIEIIATDRIDKPISSMSGKLKRSKPKLAKTVELGEGTSFQGDRTYARIETSNRDKARGMRAGIEKFKENYPREGAVLEGYIAEQRIASETHLVFGMYEGCRITSDDYISVMTSLGFTEATAKKLYPELMDISRNLAKKRDEVERSILIGSELYDK